jgi:hypothetical protein
VLGNSWVAERMVVSQEGLGSLHICKQSHIVYFTTLSIAQTTWLRLVGCLINYELERMWEEASVAYFNCPRLEPGISRIQIRSVITRDNLLACFMNNNIFMQIACYVLTFRLGKITLGDCVWFTTFWSLSFSLCYECEELC